MKNPKIPVARAVTNRQIPVARAVTNIQNFTLGLSPKKRDPQKSRVFTKKRDPPKEPKGRDPREVPIGPQGSPTKSPIYPHGPKNFRVQKTSRVQKTFQGSINIFFKGEAQAPPDKKKDRNKVVFKILNHPNGPYRPQVK